MIFHQFITSGVPSSPFKTGIGKIVNCAVEEAALTDGKPDATKMKPICFDTCGHVYRIMGDVVANAFSVGKELHS